MCDGFISFTEIMKEQLKQFIDHYPNISSSVLQTFDDNKSRKDSSLSSIRSLKNIDWDKVDELNQKGAGIFFTVNSMVEGSSRSIDKVTNLNAWICEIDDASKEEQRELIKKSPLQPSCIVESKNGYHLYRFAQDATLANRRKICR